MACQGSVSSAAIDFSAVSAIFSLPLSTAIRHSDCQGLPLQRHAGGIHRRHAMTARLIDRPLGEGWNTLTKLVMDARFTGSLADEIRKPGGVDRAFKALTLEFFPAPAATVVSAPEVQDLYVLPLLDADVPEAHKATAAKYRALAREWGVPYTHAVCYLVREGFTLKGHAAKAGPCYKDFQGLQGWNFQDDPTVGCLKFWIP